MSNKTEDKNRKKEEDINKIKSKNTKTDMLKEIYNIRCYMNPKKESEDEKEFIPDEHSSNIMREVDKILEILNLDIEKFKVGKEYSLPDNIAKILIAYLIQDSTKNKFLSKIKTKKYRNITIEEREKLLSDILDGEQYREINTQIDMSIETKHNLSIKIEKDIEKLKDIQYIDNISHITNDVKYIKKKLDDILNKASMLGLVYLDRETLNILGLDEDFLKEKDRKYVIEPSDYIELKNNLNHIKDKLDNFNI